MSQILIPIWFVPAFGVDKILWFIPVMAVVFYADKKLDGRFGVLTPRNAIRTNPGEQAGT